ncbi:MAG: RNA methyltransferase, partial [Microgenomates group bacterium GW2011_GWA2_44_7]
TAPKRIVYVSCSPSTLARDLKILCQDGYKVSSVQAFDMFPQTTHVETVVKLQVPINFLTDQEW